MIEGKKISQLGTIQTLFDGCCFPVLSKGATKRITFSVLVDNIIARLPDINREELEQIKAKLQEHESEITELLQKDYGIEEVIRNVEFQINGQNRTILEYTESVQELQRVYEEATISGGVVDSSLNTESTNPVQNKVLAKLIPTQASANNKLTTKSYVDESIQTNSAINRGSFETYADLMAYSGTVTRNDYATVANDETHDNEAWRYKWNDELEEWTPEYMVNESPMTLEQLAALNSGITEELVAQIGQGGGGVPVGTIHHYIGIVAPEGYLMCDKSYNATDYPQLWAVLPDSLKNISEGTFDIDFRELVIVGAGQNASKDIKTHDVYNVGEFKDDQVQAHYHAKTETAHSHGITNFNSGSSNNNFFTKSGSSPSASSPYAANGSTNGATSNTVITGMTKDTSVADNLDPRKGTTTHGKQIGFNYIIKY